MSAEYFYGAGRRGVPKRSGKPSRTDPRGRPATGRIAKILVGQDHGLIRLRDDREIFFHRGDVREGTAFNDLHIGDTVTFELLEDSVSGARYAYSDEQVSGSSQFWKSSALPRTASMTRGAGSSRPALESRYTRGPCFSEL